jgi:hypothetical protein
MSEVGYRAFISERRRALGLSREVLGARAGGLASTTIWRAEHGSVQTKPETAALILAALAREEELVKRRLVRVEESVLWGALYTQESANGNGHNNGNGAQSAAAVTTHQSLTTDKEYSYS